MILEATAVEDEPEEAPPQDKAKYEDTARGKAEAMVSSLASWHSTRNRAAALRVASTTSR